MKDPESREVIDWRRRDLKEFAAAAMDADQSLDTLSCVTILRIGGENWHFE